MRCARICSSSLLILLLTLFLPASSLSPPGAAQTSSKVIRVWTIGSPHTGALPPAVAPGKAVVPSAPTRPEAPGAEAPRLRFGAPDAGDEIFKPRANVEQNTTPRLDLEATRQRAREIASDGSAYRGIAPVIPAPAPIDRKSKLAEAIDKAQKPDCRTAYADMGLLAVVPLVASTIADGNGGCRW